MKYKKKPVTIEAWKWTFAPGQEETPPWLNSALANGIVNFYPDMNSFTISTLEGTMRGHVGDFIIKGVRGELYCCEQGIFKETYDLAE